MFIASEIEYLCISVEPIEAIAFPSTSVVYGPVWVSKGGGFVPAGAHSFTEAVITRVREHLRSAKQCR